MTTDERKEQKEQEKKVLNRLLAYKKKAETVISRKRQNTHLARRG